MTTNQMIKLFAEILKDAPPVVLSEAERAAIREACKPAPRVNSNERNHVRR